MFLNILKEAGSVVSWDYDRAGDVSPKGPFFARLRQTWQIDKDEKITKFSWVTDIPITEGNVYQLMQAGRAPWKVENKTFNTP